jgi:hypothetical protein
MQWAAGGGSEPLQAGYGAQRLPFVSLLALVLITGYVTQNVAHAESVFPGTVWESRAPEAVGMDAAKLDELAARLGGRGCVVKNGYAVKTWGDQAERSDWYSSAKPVLSTMLFFAIQEGLVKNVDQRVADFGWELKPKDQTMTFRHLGAMTSGYARPEAPGEAWAYNDFAIQLYQKTLFDKVFKGDAVRVAEDPNRLGALGLQDGLRFSDKRRLAASVRDFARIVWFWVNKGRWDGKQALDRRFFDEYMTPQVPKQLPRTQKADEDDYLGIGSYGGSSDQTYYGSGIYGFNWWFNDTGRFNPDTLMWPDAPRDTVMSLGFGGNCSAFVPSLDLAIVCAEGEWGDETPGDPASPMNQLLKLAAEAAGYQRGRVLLSDEMRKWHDVTLSFLGPASGEQADPNPFTDYRLDVTFTCGEARYTVPGYYAADGNAANTSAKEGPIWRVHFAPDREGVWTYRASFRTGPGTAMADEAGAGEPAAFDGVSGSFTVAPSDKAAPDFRAKGMLRYTGGRYLQFADTGEYYLKGGADSPENFLAFADFDQTPPSHRYEPHAADHRFDDPVWKKNKGGNIFGALNYLAGKGMNSVYFLTMNVEGDGKDVWPWTSDRERYRFDCSKLDQWDIVFSHMDKLGILLHVVTQEQENDQVLDGGELGPERRLYYRELAARFAHHPALVWNLGEENTNTDAQRKAFADYVRRLDPYGHPVVVHTFPGQYDEVYESLLGYPHLEGPSLQMGDMKQTHDETLKWVRRSVAAGRPWFVCLDEIGPADTGVKPDADDPNHDEVRRYALWGNLMAGGAGSEWLFGYEYAHNDINCEDWRSRDRMWDLTRYAIAFFQQYLPFTEMEPADELVTGEGAWCLAKRGDVYAVYAPKPDNVKLDLPPGRYHVQWYNPRQGGPLEQGKKVRGGGQRFLGKPPADRDQDWVILVRNVTDDLPQKETSMLVGRGSPGR